MADVSEPVKYRPSINAERAYASLPGIPLGWALVFAVYLVAAFALMAYPHAFPDRYAFRLANVSVDVTQVHEFFFRFSVLGLGLVPLVLLADLLAMGWKRSSLRSLFDRSDLSSRSDFVCFLIVHFHAMRWPQVILTFGFAWISGTMVQTFAAQHLGLHLSYDWMSPWVRFPLFFFMYTFFDYVAHRVDHSDLFWPLHRFHHAAEDFNVLTADRGHPASSLTQSGLKVFPLVLLGVPAEAIIDLGMLVAAINYLNHSRIDWDFGWFGRWIIQSPRHHQLHHARQGVVSNYSVCPLWDRIGGTWRDAEVEPVDMGVTDSYAHGWFIVTDVMRDYRDFLRAIARNFRRLLPARTMPVRSAMAETLGDAPVMALEKTLLPDPMGASDTQLMVH